jgi:selenocysteine lyase/cysteine desulfurase
MSLENHFSKFRQNIVGCDAEFQSPYGIQKIIYADWIASGRLYHPIEEKMLNIFGPFVANTHTETNETGTRMTQAYHHAQKLIKQHVNANSTDVIITAGSGMTSVINKFQRILGLKTCGKISNGKCIQDDDKPVVFITHMEHHSNHTSWYSTTAEVVHIKPNNDLLVDENDLREKLEKYKHRKFKIGSFTACSNVTGVNTNYHELAKIMHQFGGVCFVDFAASAPYDEINMHPENAMEKLDAIFFSPHKFLGGPGTSGVLIFDKAMYKSEIPDNPGGGTVEWTNPWGEYKFIDDIEIREDGGTPAFLQVIRIALSIELKNQMGIENIKKREAELLKICFEELDKIDEIHILANNIRERLGVISFFHHEIHYNLFVKLLNDKFGVQVRGGCACAGTYGHYLLEVSHDMSKRIADKINSGDLSEKPGWVRLSLHPTMTNDEIYFILSAIKEIVKNYKDFAKDYIYNKKTNEFQHKTITLADENEINKWFNLTNI